MVRLQRRKGSSIALVFTLVACICVARKNQVFLFYKNDFSLQINDLRYKTACVLTDAVVVVVVVVGGGGGGWTTRQAKHAFL